MYFLKYKDIPKYPLDAFVKYDHKMQCKFISFLNILSSKRDLKFCFSLLGGHKWIKRIAKTQTGKKYDIPYVAESDVKNLPPTYKAFVDAFTKRVGDCIMRSNSRKVRITKCNEFWKKSLPGEEEFYLKYKLNLEFPNLNKLGRHNLRNPNRELCDYLDETYGPSYSC